MDVKEVLRFTDNLVFAKTGKHLADLQETVLRGVWQGKTYIQIAEESGYSEGYTRDVTSKLLKVLSKLLREDINKSNFRSTMERYQISHSSNFLNLNFVEKGSINVCTEASQPPKTSQNSPPTQTSTEDDTQQKPRLDLRDAPTLKTFYNYPNSPLTALETWILEQNCRLLTITGMAGTGKSA
ncbi:ATPase, partial [Microcoleus sp. herbarium5]